MENWTEIRSAAEVARLGTVSAAAASLGVHRATVNRHIEALEETLGGTLFQRHARGYAPTELGLELLRVANATEEQLAQLVRRAQSYGAGLRGELVVTSVAMIAGEILPVINSFRSEHPLVRTRYLCGDTVLKLEYGEAHVAFRVGAKPQDPDNVVRLSHRSDVALYAAPSYVAKHGVPSGMAEFANHAFIGSDSPSPRAPFLAWLKENVPASSIALTSNDGIVLEAGVIAGCGIGFLPTSRAASHGGLVEVLPPRESWSVPVWIVTHVDLHRTAKVQGFLRHVQELSG